MNGIPPQFNLQQLYTALQWQFQKLQELDQKINQLQDDMEKLSKQRPMVVDKIEYRFDQLKIDKLEGTLHIGVSPHGDKTIEDLNVNGEPVETMSYNNDLFQCVQRRIEHYLSNECPAYIHNMEEKYRMIIGKDYRNTMIQDIRKQVDHRIESYMKSMSVGNNEEQNQKEQMIVDKLKTDIQTAIDQHIQNHKEKGMK